jgi:aquaporin Z
MQAKKYAAEAIGTFWLTFAGCGSAVFAAAFPQVCHLNPAVTIALTAGRRFPARDVLVSQVVGGVLGAAVLYMIAKGGTTFDVARGFASNGYGDHSPGHYGLGSALSWRCS